MEGEKQSRTISVPIHIHKRAAQKCKNKGHLECGENSERQTDRQTDRQTGRDIDIDKDINIDIDRETERERNREPDTQTQTDTERKAPPRTTR